MSKFNKKLFAMSLSSQILLNYKTYTEFALANNFNIKHINKWTSGRHLPTLASLQKLMVALPNVDFLKLLQLSQTPKPMIQNRNITDVATEVLRALDSAKHSRLRTELMAFQQTQAYKTPELADWYQFGLILSESESLNQDAQTSEKVRKIMANGDPATEKAQEKAWENHQAMEEERIKHRGEAS